MDKTLKQVTEKTSRKQGLSWQSLRSMKLINNETKQNCYITF